MGERKGTKALEIWCRRITEGYSGVKIENMTSSWRDGLAFCAMIHHFRPDLIEFEKLNKTNVYYNNDLAFSTAEKYLGIPALLDADDMSTYEVPDRLSILTYLSQFYQMFAAQDSPNRLKRLSETEEKSQINKTQGPPSKMAHVVGVPKCDPCQKCGFPVFLAERLIVGENVYHRTCLKCTRCGAQLAPGSFCETEVNDEYCCEICPEEEQEEVAGFDVRKVGSMKYIDPTISTDNPGNEGRDNSDDDAAVASACSKLAVRNCIAERLAFFEQNQEGGNKVLQKSLSDEEKSKSLSRLSENLRSPSQKTNTIQAPLITSVLNDVIDNSNDNIETMSNDTKSEDSLDALSSNEAEQTEFEKNMELPSHHLLSPLQKQIFHKKVQIVDDLESADSARLSVNDLLHVLTPITLEDNIAHTDNTNKVILSEDSTKGGLIMSTEKDILFANQVDNRSSITKDQFDVQTRRNEADVILRQLETSEKTDEPNEKLLSIDDDTTRRLSVVRTRLHQFEKIANNRIEKPTLGLEIKNIINDKENKNEIHSKNDKQYAIDTVESDNTEEESVLKNETESLKIVPLKDEHENVEANNTISIRKDQEESEENLSENLVTKTRISPDNNAVTENIDEYETVNKNTISKPDSNVVNFETNETTISKQTEKHNRAQKSPGVAVKNEHYPEGLNPFQNSDEEEEEEISKLRKSSSQDERNIFATRKSLNPFDSSDDEIEIEKKAKPPRPPPPKISTNPFGSESDDENLFIAENTANLPVPAPRTNISLLQTPEPTPRLKTKHHLDTNTPNTNGPRSSLNNFGDYYGSSASLGSNLVFQRDSSSRSSINSLSSSASTIRSKKSKKSPAPPPPVKELFPSTETVDSKMFTPTSSNSATPCQSRKKRPAPAPPKPARVEKNLLYKSSVCCTDSKNFNSYPLQNDLDKLSDEEKALLEGKDCVKSTSGENGRRVIPLDFSIVDDATSDYTKHKEEDHSVYRRTIIPHQFEAATEEYPSLVRSSYNNRQSEKLKDNKEAKNRTRKGQISTGVDELDQCNNKSTQSSTSKRQKGPAPALPIPPRKVPQMLPLQEIKHELEIIEVQQQGLERQGVVLEKMIRDRCEGNNGDALKADKVDDKDNPRYVPNSKEVEDLILQLFELVNEKNELFRRQAELMYLRRQNRLEQEQADIEYDIRVLMAQPERNKTDSDKAREEFLIARLVKVVQLRNEVVDCLEMDRLREAEEDISIKHRLELHSANREEKLWKRTIYLSKKEKKKQKEAKKLGKIKVDADKDTDESERYLDDQKIKKKKKKFIF